jgi:hypothetical protein
VEVLPSGAISFCYQYRTAGHKECVVLGTYPTLSLAKAGQKHRAFQTMVEHRIALRVLSTHPSFCGTYRTSIDRGYHAQRAPRRMMDRGVKGLSHFTVHDLRRTARCELDECGCISR